MSEEKEIKPNEESKSSKKLILILIAIIAVVGITVAALLLWPKEDTQPKAPQQTKEVTPQKTAPVKSEWKEYGVVVPGNYADAEVIKTATGYRIFYGLEPEVKGFKNQVYTAVSTDGITWTGNKEIMTGVTFPSVIETADGYRMYYQGTQGLGVQAIMSAVSADGDTWTKETGARLANPGTVDGVTIESIAAPTVEKLKDGTYLMVFRGSFEKKYAERVPNQNTSLLFSATSPDGLTFTAKGLAVDTRNDEMQGMVDGPEFYTEGEKTDLYFWGYNGVYKSSYKDGKFADAGKPELEPFDKKPNMVFSPNPPGDPTVIKVGGKLLLYYGQHEKGIYLATKEVE